MLRVIDLSFPIGRNVSSLLETFPHREGDYSRLFTLFDVSPLFTHKEDQFSMQKVTIPTHTPYAAHLDAPYHELKDGKTIDQMPVESFVGEAVVLDARERNGKGITVDGVSKQLDEIRENDAVLLRTDWDKKYGTREYFEGSPFIGMDLAQLLVEKKVRCVGIDFPIPEDTERRKRNEPDADKPVIHYLLLGNGVYIIESLSNFHQISQKRPFLVTLPLNIVGADGFPVRAVAIEGLRLG